MANVGGTDRVVRFVVGIVLILVGLFSTLGFWSWVILVIGVVMLLTAIFRYCPAYSVAGVRTCPRE